MRGLADPLFRRREPEPRPHRPVQEGVGLDAGRPNALVEPADHDPVEGEQAGLEQAQDLDTGVAPGRRRDGALAGEAREEGRIIDEAAANAAAAIRCSEVVEEHLQRAKGFILHRVGGLEQLFDRPAMRLRDGNEIETVPVSRRRRKSRKGIAQAREEIGSSVPFPPREAAARARGVTGILRATHREGVGKTVKTGPRGGSAQHADLERRGGPLHLGAIETKPEQRMRQEGEHADGMEIQRRRVGRQAGEAAGERVRTAALRPNPRPPRSSA